MSATVGDWGQLLGDIMNGANQSMGMQQALQQYQGTIGLAGYYDFNRAATAYVEGAKLYPEGSMRDDGTALGWLDRRVEEVRVKL